MPKPKLLYYSVLNYLPSVLDFLNKQFDVATIFDPDCDGGNVEPEIEIIIAPLDFRFDENRLSRFENLKVIASSTLSIPHIDKVYCEQNGIRICHLGHERDWLNAITPTAEVTWGLIIALTRKIPWAFKSVCAGEWRGRSFGRKTSRMLSNMTLGIIGLGRIGSLVASYGSAFGMTVYYFSPSAVDPAYTRCETLTDLAKMSDVVSLHAHLTAETKKMIDEQFFNVMKPGSFFINTARGAIVDEDALLAALENGRLAGAALDVFAQEYQPDFQTSLSKSPLIQYAKSHDNLLITPHYAGATVDAWEMTQRKIIELIIDECHTFI